MKDLKYLLAYVVPLVIFISLWLKGWMSFFAVAFLFGFVPFMELFLPGTTENRSSTEEKSVLKLSYFDFLLYLNVPILYGLVGYFLYIVSTESLAWYEYIGLTWSVGIGCGAIGINVGHELGHRKKPFERFLAKLLLMCALYLHFYIEHNRGHHRHVATPKDPATARKGETVYFFLFRSIFGGYISAWKLETHRLKKQGLSWFTLQNQMLQFQLIQFSVILALYFTLGPLAAGLFIVAAFVGIIELEMVNYLEHYGLLRKEITPGIYERVQPHHSWNSNHTLGRILLYELTRHSDHHYLASRKYQVLRHFQKSPELPTGYPGMMLLSLVPPLWFKVMHHALKEERAKIAV